MLDTDLTQPEADALIAMPKMKVSDDEWEYPNAGDSISVPLTSDDKREQFLLDLSRGRIDLRRGKYQNRARNVVVLVRLDFGGPAHRNPDDAEIPCPHLHLYREGYGHKWAYPVPGDRFRDIQNLWQALLDFMEFCNVVDPPRINRGLFA